MRLNLQKNLLCNIPFNSLTFPKIIGHRGACGHAPENTLASLIQAHAMGLHAVEFDVRLAADGELILFHDALLERTTNGHGRVFDRAYQTLSTLDAGSWFDPSYADQHIMNFLDVINVLQKLQLMAVIDIKVDEPEELVVADKLIEVLNRHWPQEFALPLLSSFSIDCLARLKTLSGDYPFALLLHEYRTDWLTLCQQLNCGSLHVDFQVLTDAWITEIQQADITLRVFTVNEAPIAIKLFSQGVEGIITDFPDRMVEYLTSS